MRAGERAVRGARSEPAEVWVHDGRPVRFGWRGRLYAVLAVLERPGEQDPAAADHADTQVREAWRCWTVRASPGLRVPGDVFLLCQDTTTGRWRLSRDAA